MQLPKRKTLSAPKRKSHRSPKFCFGALMKKYPAAAFLLIVRLFTF